MKKYTNIIIINLLLFLTASTSFSSMLQTGFYEYDLLSSSIFPYFAHLYDKKLPSTLLFFPDWEENSGESFLRAGKKDNYGTFYDLYFTGQYSGNHSIAGMHIDNIQVQIDSDSAYDSAGANTSWQHNYDNKGRAGVWYSINGLNILRGISCIANFNQLEYDSFNNSSFEYNKNASKYNSFHGKLISQYKLFKTGVLRLYMQYTRSAQRNKETVINSAIDTTHKDVTHDGKYAEISLGYLLNNPKKRNTFFAGIGYSASFLKDKSVNEWNGPLYTDDREISSVFFEAYDAKKLSIEKLDIYLGIGGSFQSYFYIYDKGNLSFFKKFKEYDRDYLEYRSYLFFPLFLQYKIIQNFALFSSWKPSFSHSKYLYGSNADYAQRIETKLNFSDASLGMILTIKEKFQFTLMPNFTENLKLTGIEAGVSF